MQAPVPVDDEARVAALHRLGILDQPPPADFEGLARLAAFVTAAHPTVPEAVNEMFEAFTVSVPALLPSVMVVAKPPAE